MGFFGKPSPCRVTLIIAGRIQLEHLDKASAAAIVAAGLELKREWFGHGHIPFDEKAGEIGNPDFERKLLALARAGIGFQEDYKQGWAPADVMRELQERGTLVGSFKSVAWDGEKTLLRDNPPDYTPKA